MSIVHVGSSGLSAADIERFHVLDAASVGLHRRMKSDWREFAANLAEIREDRLYLAEFGTFEEYCRVRYGITRQTAHNWVEGHAVTKLLSVAPETASKPAPALNVVNELRQLPPSEQPSAYNEVLQTADRFGKKPSGTIARGIVQRRKSSGQKMGMEQFARRAPAEDEFYDEDSEVRPTESEGPSGCEKCPACEGEIWLPRVIAQHIRESLGIS